MPEAQVTTGLPGLDRVLRGIRAGDNMVWGVESFDDYRKLVLPYAGAARRAGARLIYFRFAPHPPLFETGSEAEIHRIDPTIGFEQFVRAIHEVISRVGVGAAYVFDSISALGDAWHSDLALGNFFVLTCPRLRDLRTFTYFAIERDRHSIHAFEPIRETTQFFLDVFTFDGHMHIRPVKVQYRSQEAMDTLHVETSNGEFRPVEESATLAGILTTTRWPRLLRNRRSGYWDRMYRRMDRVLDEESTDDGDPAEHEAVLAEVRSAFRVHRSGIASLASKWLDLDDFQAIRQRMIGVGSIGGKALGMLVARAILRAKAPDLSSRLEVHDSFFVGAEVFVTFLVKNNVWWIREQARQSSDPAEALTEGRKRILAGEFPRDILVQFEGMLDYFGECPCIVRSSSILEDALGNAFSGKYESIFLANRGSREERLAALLDAVRKVYASILDPEAILYRRNRGLLDTEERMALLIMRVSGRQRGRHFFPQAAGVGLSYNPWCWDPDIDPDAGIARLVFGLGTRAVDRPDDDYTRLVSLSAPLRRPEATVDEEHDHSQRGMDAIDLNQRQVVSLPVDEVAPLCSDFPLRLFIDQGEDRVPWVTFNRLLRETNVIADIRRMLSLLAAEYEAPVDIEFTLNFIAPDTYRIHLLQCRTFQVRKHLAGTHEVPGPPPKGTSVIQAAGAVIGLGREIPIHDLLYIGADDYSNLGEQDRYSVARLIEKLVSQHDTTRNLILVGPGRWGTGSPSLGIPVRAGRIERACAVCEVVAMHGGLVPDVSLGTHFFNDLVEHDLLYLACFPHRPGNHIDATWLANAPSLTQKLAPKAPPRATACVRWIDLSGTPATLHADPLTQQAGIYLA